MPATYINVIAASVMHRVCIGHESGMRRATDQVTTPSVELGESLFGNSVIVKELISSIIAIPCL